MAHFNFTPFPHLETERLSLGPLSLQDENEVFFLRSDAEVNKYLDRPGAVSRKDARNYILKINAGIKNNEWLLWGIHFKNQRGLIGTICYWNLSPKEKRAEIGFELLPQHQGKGHMQEAVVKVVAFGFEKLQLKTIEAWLRKDNHSSLKVLEKNHFKRDREAETRMPPEDKTKGMIIYSLTNTFSTKFVTTE